MKKIVCEFDAKEEEEYYAVNLWRERIYGRGTELKRNLCK
jgi:hypothetical protein